MFVIVLLVAAAILLAEQGGAYTCPAAALGETACLGDAHCQWNAAEQRCVNSLPCSLERNQLSCTENSWDCVWRSGACTSRTTTLKDDGCSARALEECEAKSSCTLTSDKLACKRRPTIILSLADDLGWYDVEWNNPRARTPVLNALREQGTALHRHYTSRFCAPTRAMLLTGVLPWRLGMQTDANLNPAYVLRCSSADAASKNSKARLLPEVLGRRGGYSTHAFGKWHLGHSRVEDLPTTRGFDTFLGFYGGGIDNQARDAENRFETEQCSCASKVPSGNGRCRTFGVRDQFCVSARALVNDTKSGQHQVVDPALVEEETVDLFLANQAAHRIASTPSEVPLFLYLSWSAPHNPVYAPRLYQDLLAHSRPEFGMDAYTNQFCSSALRREHLAMVNMLDEAHRIVLQALERANRYEDTVFIFLSDNGGNTPVFDGKTNRVRKCSYGSNYPLRGSKFTWWEGGVRTLAFAHALGVIPARATHAGLFSATDWKSTLLQAAGVSEDSNNNEDSVSFWDALTTNSAGATERKELALQVWLEQRRYVVLYEHEGEVWKMIQGYPWSGLGAGNAKSPDPIHAQGYLFQPPELPLTELLANASNALPDAGLGMRCAKRACLFNLDRDPSELKDLGALASSAKRAGDALVRKYRAQGTRVVPDSKLCQDKIWFADNKQDATDKTALLMAKQCGGYTAWVGPRGERRTECAHFNEV